MIKSASVDETVELRTKPKVVVVMPAYNAEQTLQRTYSELPKDKVDLVILVDDGSRDHTIGVARRLDLKLFVHNRNYGYGANQKTCYTEAIKAGADVVAMVHPDYQYDPTLLPAVLAPIEKGEADVVLGSRLMGVSPVQQGMPWWKYLGNRFLTKLENWVFGLNLAEYHTGYRAFRREVLESVDFHANSDKFLFDQDIIAQIVGAGFRIAQVPVPTRYFPEASSASLPASVAYGLGILKLLVKYWLHKKGIWRRQQFVSHSRRYQQVK
jgi:glycosyltransferase involved in cell wall biosynthesis